MLYTQTGQKWQKPEDWFLDEGTSELARNGVWLGELRGQRLVRRDWRLYFRSTCDDETTKRAIAWFLEGAYKATSILFFKDRASGVLYAQFTRNDWKVEK